MRRKPDQILEARSTPVFEKAVKTVTEDPTAQSSFKLNSWEHVILGTQSAELDRTTMKSADICFGDGYIHAVLAR